MSNSFLGGHESVGTQAGASCLTSPTLEQNTVTSADSKDLAQDIEDLLPPLSTSPTGNRPCRCSRTTTPAGTTPAGTTPAGGRNLVVCIDGTANQFGTITTNVIELYSRLHKDEAQLTYYNSGIGTYAKKKTNPVGRWKQAVGSFMDITVALNFKKIVLGAYHGLCENHKPGDRIFLFGFSRGAYQVRVIAAMIRLVGLLHKGNIEQIAFAYRLYTEATVTIRRDETDGKDNDAQGPKHSDGEVKTSLPTTTKHADNPGDDDQEDDYPGSCARFKKIFSKHNVQVHFVGAWDTVSSVGFVRKRALPNTTTGMQHVCVFRQALALDELRVKYLPEYANGGAGPLGAGKSEGDVKEVWFPGWHSDMYVGRKIMIPYLVLIIDWK
ncbi:hypothetical protein PUNSTDRAFT_69720 [Punctularia strigosozonata HHB-11173 SS5]|uniref:uncharacterized protein n=1 Tax=Punctularia strigosozonata (strain HHB-11173) TaxID=741275 RepID=UPI0004417750|nr:uncharacterized protein PUNSTDRAFT_69720 [Punctularia strigosozonata HHB-11173 SS5]EIN07573.1 hypothetical protein PUNSTDRAFT_69720 [Punctularia strigosozonata HHB-11173 SS5]